LVEDIIAALSRFKALVVIARNSSFTYKGKAVDVRQVGRELRRACGPAAPAPKPRRVFISGQKRGVFGIIKRELRRRSAIEPLIGHMKEEGHLGRCHLKGHAGDAANAILTAAGCNFRRILAWLRMLLRSIFQALFAVLIDQQTLNPAS
jgi:hypothetical protein